MAKDTTTRGIRWTRRQTIAGALALIALAALPLPLDAAPQPDEPERAPSPRYRDAPLRLWPFYGPDNPPTPRAEWLSELGVRIEAASFAPGGIFGCFFWIDNDFILLCMRWGIDDATRHRIERHALSNLADDVKHPVVAYLDRPGFGLEGDVCISVPDADTLREIRAMRWPRGTA